MGWGDSILGGMQPMCTEKPQADADKRKTLH
jgi:hypothetical protein